LKRNLCAKVGRIRSNAQESPGAAIQGLIFFRLKAGFIGLPDHPEGSGAQTKNARRKAPGIL